MKEKIIETSNLKHDFLKKKNITIYKDAKIIGIENIDFGHDIIIDDFALIIAREKIKFGNMYTLVPFVQF